MNIRDTIVADRRKRITEQGYSMGCNVPREREVPLVPFRRSPFCICEVKRRSPSKGDIAPGMDAVDQARLYTENGIQSVSVLTEEAYFGGSLNDLMVVKKTFPDCAFLRKDFLLFKEDMDISYRAGADAVLLIASLFDGGELMELYRYAKSLGLEVLLELHDDADIVKCKSFKPSLVGINSRDLKTFSVDLLIPVRVKERISWECDVVFESGLFEYEDALYAKSSGFAGILVGEAVVRKPERIPDLLAGLNAASYKPFWSNLYRSSRTIDKYSPVRKDPMVKICGLTREEDVLLADELGASLLGFIMAPSPRQVDPEFIRSLPETRGLKVGVVVLEQGVESLPPEINDLMRDGVLDVFQFHGDESPDLCGSFNVPYYKVLRIGDAEHLAAVKQYRSPRILLDARCSSGRGGTGKRIDESILYQYQEGAYPPLWLAGGIGPGNVKDLVRRFSPELVDLASGVEQSPGIKDHAKMKQLFQEVSGERI